MLWTLRYPPHRHEAVDPDDCCDADHGSGEGWRRPLVGEERERRIESERPVVDARHGRKEWGLEPGIRLRLDAVRTRLVSYPEDQPTPWGFLGGDFEETERRYCVLDGPMSGTCWETTEARAVGDPRLGDRGGPTG